MMYCRDAGGGVLQLEEVAGERLCGVIQSLAVLPTRTPGRGRDALLLTFRSGLSAGPMSFILSGQLQVF